MDILFIGGDKRSVTAYKILKEKYSVSSLGLFENDGGSIENADVIILPVPTTRDKATVNCSLTGRVVPLDDIMKAKRGAHIFTYGHRFAHYPQTDYSTLDSFCLKNAVPTAEGAIAAAINKTDFTLWKSRILIIGFGRVAKVLLSRLKGFDADITVSARKSADFGLLDALDIDYIKTEQTGSVAQNYDIIFNTVDIPLNCELNTFKKTYLFDLSTKGCVDFDAASKLGLKAFKLPSLPSKTAPLTAGKIIAETVDEILCDTHFGESR